MVPMFAFALCASLFVSQMHGVHGQTITSISPKAVKAATTQVFNLAGSTDGHTAMFQPPGVCAGAQSKTVVGNAVTVTAANAFTAGVYQLCYHDGSSASVQSTIVLTVSDSNPFAFSAVSPDQVGVAKPTALALTTVASGASNFAEWVLQTTGCAGRDPSTTGWALTAGTSTARTETFPTADTYVLCYQANANTDSVMQYFSGSLAKITATAVATSAETITSISPKVMKAGTAQTFSLAGSLDVHTVKIQLQGTGSCSGPQSKIVSANSVTVAVVDNIAPGTYEVCYHNGVYGNVQTGISITVSTSDPFAFSAVSPISVVTTVITVLTLTTVTSNSPPNPFAEWVLQTTGCVGRDLSATGWALSTGTSTTRSETFPSDGVYVLCYRSSPNSDSVMQYYSGSFAKITATAAVPVSGSDPVARFGDHANVFELAPQVLTTLLIAPDIVVQGSVFQGRGPWEQWFNRMVLTHPADSHRFMEIRMRDNLHELNQSKIPHGVFRTLEATFGYGPITHPTAFTKVTGPQVMNNAVDFLGFDIHFRKVRDSTLGNFPRECADIAGAHVHIYICSAPANEYYGNLRHLSLQYAHLDIAIIEAKNFGTLTGLLPELWGVQPMSETTAACIKNEKPEGPNGKNALTGKKSGFLDNGVGDSKGSKEAWAGGFGMEELRKGCLEHDNDSAAVLEI